MEHGEEGIRAIHCRIKAIEGAFQCHWPSSKGGARQDTAESRTTTSICKLSCHSAPPTLQPTPKWSMLKRDRKFPKRKEEELMLAKMELILQQKMRMPSQAGVGRRDFRWQVKVILNDRMETLKIIEHHFSGKRLEYSKQFRSKILKGEKRGENVHLHF